MLYRNGMIFLTDRGFVPGDFRVGDGRFTEVLDCSETAEEAFTDLAGAYVIPGLVDIHIHGALGADCSDGDPEGVRQMALYLASCGVTSFAPTMMTLIPEKLLKAVQAIREAADSLPDGGAHILGIHLEGPFLSPEKNGAQNAEALVLPDTALLAELNASCGGLIRMTDVAPELPGAEELIRCAAGKMSVSLAHTAADYDTAKAAFAAGASHVTHLFNGMPPFHHRAPGVIGAAAEEEQVTAELIADGIHIHPSAVRAAFKLFSGRICLISDALRCLGLPDGSYELGGQTVKLYGGAAHLADGRLAGAASDLYTDMRNAVRFGIPKEDAIRAASSIPAKALGVDDRAGSIACGRSADFLLTDAELRLQEVYIAGRRIVRR